MQAQSKCILRVFAWEDLVSYSLYSHSSCPFTIPFPSSFTSLSSPSLVPFTFRRLLPLFSPASFFLPPLFLLFWHSSCIYSISFPYLHLASHHSFIHRHTLFFSSAFLLRSLVPMYMYPQPIALNLVIRKKEIKCWRIPSDCHHGIALARLQAGVNSVQSASPFQLLVERMTGNIQSTSQKKILW